VWVLNFSQQYDHRFWSYRMWHCIAVKVVTNIRKKHWNPWRERWHIPLKQWEPNTCQCSITSHKTGIKAFSCSTLKTEKTCSIKYLLAIRLHHVTSKKTLLFLIAVGIMTCCRLDGPAFDLWWRQKIFCSPSMSRLALGPIWPPLQWAPWLFTNGKAFRVWQWPPTAT